MNKTKIVIFLISFISFSLQSQICRRDVVDCLGICGKMTDADGDSICDLSPRSEQSLIKTSKNKDSIKDEVQNIEVTESQLANQLNTVDKKIAKSPSDKVKTDTKTTKLLASNSQNSTDGFEVLDAPADTAVTDEWGEIAQPQNNVPVETPENTAIYPLIEISALTLGLYLITWLLAKFKVFKTSIHRKIWNVVLFITFLMSGILGLVLVFQINYNILDDWYMTFLELHVDFGISMGIISIFHILWHTKYFLTLFKKPKTVKK